jgi:hypothetical protein
MPEPIPAHPVPEAARNEGVVTILSIPIKVRGMVIGVLKLHATEEKEYTPRRSILPQPW